MLLLFYALGGKIARGFVYRAQHLDFVDRVSSDLGLDHGFSLFGSHLRSFQSRF